MIKKFWDRINKRGIILLYHRVAELAFDPFQLSVSPKHFDEQMNVIQKYGRAVTMAEMGQGLKRFSFREKEIVISFDDGYADNFFNAKPILERYNIPATFFIVSGAVNKQEEFWWDDLEKLILQSKSIPQVFSLSINGVKYHWKIKDEEQRILIYKDEFIQIPEANAELSKGRLYFALWKILSGLSYQGKKDALNQIMQWAQSSIPRTTHLPLTTKELISLAGNSNFEIGAHTVCHPMLSRLSSDEQAVEISKSKNELENMINRPITSFSYPHGDYSEITLKHVKRLNFKNACTVVHKSVKKNNDPFLLPRLMVLDWNADVFEQKLCQWMGSQ
jgi:peptidoglycan/xylan/chitin deacetylase (PgdA/CDA1 family)